MVIKLERDFQLKLVDADQCGACPPRSSCVALIEAHRAADSSSSAMGEDECLEDRVACHSLPELP